MCECNQVGGRWIAEDPSCPVHGDAGKARRTDAETIMAEVNNETDVDALRALAQQLADLIDDI